MVIFTLVFDYAVLCINCTGKQTDHIHVAHFGRTSINRECSICGKMASASIVYLMTACGIIYLKEQRKACPLVVGVVFLGVLVVEVIGDAMLSDFHANLLGREDN